MRELDSIAQSMMFEAIQIGLAVLLSWWLVHRLRTVAYRRGYRDALAAPPVPAPYVYECRVPTTATNGDTLIVRADLERGADS